MNTILHDARLPSLRKPRRTALLLAALLAVTLARAADPEYRLETLAEDLHWPWSVTRLPGGDFLVTERSGQLLHLDSRGQRRAVKGTPATLFAGEGGYFDIKLAPDYALTRHVFLSYVTGTPEANRPAIFRARYSDGKLLDGVTILKAEPPRAAVRNFGGRMLFLPDDSLLFTTGDGYENREAAQSLSGELGKVLRVDVAGEPFFDNPFSAEVAERIWTSGHRNPQGLTYDPARNVIYSIDHGPHGGDELNVLASGRNYGWPAVTSGIDHSGALVSPFRTSSYTEDPLWTWTPSIAPSAIAVYNGRAFPQWSGGLLIGSLAMRELRLLRMHKGAIIEERSLLRELGERIRDVQVFDGEIYVLTDSENGRLLRLGRR